MKLQKTKNYEYKGWRNLERSKPPIDDLVELRHIVTGIGGPEREGWISIGKMRKDGIFRIKQNDSKTVDFRPPTHWKKLAIDNNNQPINSFISYEYKQRAYNKCE